MLAPRTRLLVWVTFVGLPFAALAGASAEARSPASGVLAVFAIVVLVDAASARGALRELRVHLPELVRLQKDRAGSIDLRIENPAKTARALRIGLAFPREIATREQEQIALLPAGAVMSHIGWECTPNRRGQYVLDRVYFEAASPLGFWSARTTQPVTCELRVYPNLFHERKNVAALFLKRGALGLRAHRQAGQGREFEKLREYQHGDSIEDIHWKASAKRGHPVTKIFQVERTQEVYVIVDASRLTGRTVEMERGATVTASTQLERFVSAALILGLAAEQQGDQFGLITFSDKVLSFVRAKNGQAHYDACRDRLYTLHPQAVTPDFDELCSFIRLRLRKRALLIFLTALDDPLIAEAFTKSMELISRQHLVIVDMLKPPAANPLFSSGDVSRVDEIYGQLGGHLQWHQLRELQKVLQRRGVRLAQLDSDKLAAQVVAQHAEVKARQLV